MTSLGGLTTEGFDYDKETFRYGFVPSQNAEDIPKFDLEYPQPLPDSPSNPCFPGYYLGPRTSRLIAAAVDDDMGVGGSGEAPAPTDKQHLQQALHQIAQMRAQNL